MRSPKLLFPCALALGALVLTDSTPAEAATTPELAWEAPLTSCLPADLVVDAAGHTFVACHVSFGSALRVLAYGSDGRMVAQRDFTNTPQSGLRVQDLALAGGKLYVAYTDASATDAVATIVALDAATLGEQWRAALPASRASSIAVLPDGGAWLVGISQAATLDIVAARFAATGAKLADVRLDSGDDDSLGSDGRSAAPGPGGGVYVGGFTNAYRLLADGAVAWTAPVASTAVAADAAGRLVVTNMREPTGNTYRLARDGHTEWHANGGGGALAVASDGNVWVAGTRVTQNASDWNLEAALLHDDGAVAFVDVYDGRQKDQGVDVALDGAGAAYVLGSSFVQSGLTLSDRYVVLKYTASARRVWSHLYGRTGLPAAIGVLPDGRPVATGFDGTVALREATTQPRLCPRWWPFCWGG